MVKEYRDSVGLPIEKGIYIKGNDILSVRLVALNDKGNWIYKRPDYHFSKLSRKEFKKYRRLSLMNAKKLQRKTRDVSNLIVSSIEQLAEEGITDYISGPHQLEIVT